MAIKVLKIQDMPDEMLDEFDREIDLMTKLRHKNIGSYDCNTILHFVLNAVVF